MAYVYAELIFETGAKSVACYDSEEEAVAAVKAHHERAATGEEGGPAGNPAERVVKVELYSKHPNDLNADQVLSTEVAQKELAGLLKVLDQDGSVSVIDLATRVRDLSSPMVVDVKAHESMFKMPSDKVLTATKWAA